MIDERDYWRAAQDAVCASALGGLTMLDTPLPPAETITTLRQQLGDARASVGEAERLRAALTALLDASQRLRRAEDAMAALGGPDLDDAEIERQCDEVEVANVTLIGAEIAAERLLRGEI